GREISRPAEEIIKEVKKLIEKGYKEITLLGQNVNSYASQMTNDKFQMSNQCQKSPATAGSRLGGTNSKQISACVETMTDKKNSKRINFPQLLKIINNIPGNFWIRFLTSHPKDMSDELIETMAKCEKVCEYVHLPIQAGDNKILQKMNRRYTVARYLKLIKKIKRSRNLEALPPSALGGKASKLPVAISTDIIVGFPGETKAQFANTAKIMRSVRYDMAYLAQYSPRAGTAAAKLKDNVSITEKKRRKEFLNEILRKTALSNNKKYIGKIVEVLIEKVENGIATGKTRTFKNVKISLTSSNCHPELVSGSKKLDKKSKTQILNQVQNNTLKPGSFALIKITQANAWGLEGEIAE
ncbi:radical SAM protein, partial [Patescibacteria group bacterium]|nr:radical SAM protein [Patescibacteria group bacterium]